MNDLVSLHNGIALTSTLAVAEGTGNEHKSVLQLIRTYIDDFDSFGRVTFEMRPFETAGGIQSREAALLNEQQATLLLTYMRNSEVIRKFKRKLVHAFFELAKMVQQPTQTDPIKVLNDPVAMRGLLLTYTEKAIALEAANQEMRPTVVAFNRIADADGSLSLRESAKALQYPERKLHQFMHSADWLFRSPKGNWMGYAEKTKAGYLTHKVTPYFDEKTQEDKVSHQVRVTPAGLTKLAKMLGIDPPPAAVGNPAA